MSRTIGFASQTFGEIGDELIYLLGMFAKYVVAGMIESMKFGLGDDRADDFKQVDTEFHRR